MVSVQSQRCAPLPPGGLPTDSTVSLDLPSLTRDYQRDHSKHVSKQPRNRQKSGNHRQRDVHIPENVPPATSKAKSVRRGRLCVNHDNNEGKHLHLTKPMRNSDRPKILIGGLAARASTPTAARKKRPPMTVDERRAAATARREKQLAETKARLSARATAAEKRRALAATKRKANKRKGSQKFTS